MGPLFYFADPHTQHTSRTHACTHAHRHTHNVVAFFLIRVRDR